MAHSPVRTVCHSSIPQVIKGLLSATHISVQDYENTTDYQHQQHDCGALAAVKPPKKNTICKVNKDELLKVISTMISALLDIFNLRVTAQEKILLVSVMAGHAF